VRNCAGLATLGGAGEAVDPGSRVSCFGHLGDGNIHFSVSGNELAFVRSLAAWHLGRLGPAFPGIDQAVVASTIGRRTLINRFDDESGRCSGFEV